MKNVLNIFRNHKINYRGILRFFIIFYDKRVVITIFGAGSNQNGTLLQFFSEIDRHINVRAVSHFFQFSFSFFYRRNMSIFHEILMKNTEKEIDNRKKGM